MGCWGPSSDPGVSQTGVRRRTPATPKTRTIRPFLHRQPALAGPAPLGGSTRARIIQSPRLNGSGFSPGRPVSDEPLDSPSWLTKTPLVAVGLKPTLMMNVEGTLVGFTGI